MNEHRLITLGDILRLEIDAVPIDPAETYNIAGVYSFGRGLFARVPLSGAKTSYKYFHRLHAGDFVISEPKAWEGAIARIPDSFEGWFLSPVFPTFRLKSKDVIAEYLQLFFKQPRLWNALRTGAKGLGARRETVSPAQFLSAKLLFPSISEQERIVLMLQKVEIAMKLNEEVGKELGALFKSALSSVFHGEPLR
jgi:type I restriction enzyme S subunit